MDPIENSCTEPRDPFGSGQLYSEKLFSVEEFLSHCKAELQASTDPKSTCIEAQVLSNEAARNVSIYYAAGCDVATVLEQVCDVFAAGEQALELREGVEGLHPYRHPFAVNGFGEAMRAFAAFAFAFCLAPDKTPTRRFFDLLNTERGPEQLFDLLARVFDPNRPIAKQYPKIPSVQGWTQPVLAALSQPPDKRAAALAAHMKNWQALMRPFGLKTKPKEYHDLFPYFAFDVALAVCAFDIDDSSFRDHPHYPRDLVEHYRTHLRHTRDADRPIGIDPGLPAMEIKKPPKADLAKSKRKGIARWIELVTDGDVDAIEAVLEKTGKPRKVQDAWDLMCALSEEVNHAVHADIKDDATAAAQAEMLARDREIGEFVPPESPPEGPARITKTLLAFDAWLSERGHRLVGVDNDDDAFHAVVVRATHLDELLALSASLGIRAETADAAFGES